MRAIVSRMDSKRRVSTVQTSVASELLSIRNFQRGCVSQMISEFGKDLRKPATAGKVCTISPREPSLTIKKRGSGMRGLANRFEHFACGVIFGITDNDDADSEAGSSLSFRDGFLRVVRALSVDVGTQLFEKP